VGEGLGEQHLGAVLARGEVIAGGYRNIQDIAEGLPERKGETGSRDEKVGIQREACASEYKERKTRKC